MKANIFWFIGGYLYCLLVSYIIEYRGKKVHKKYEDIN